MPGAGPGGSAAGALFSPPMSFTALSRFTAARGRVVVPPGRGRGNGPPRRADPRGGSPFIRGSQVMPQRIQNVFNVTANAAAVSRATLPPLMPGDLVEGLTLYVRGANGVNAPDDNLTVTLVAGNVQPGSDAEALAAPFKLLDAITVPMVPIPTDDVNGFTYFVNLTLPLFMEVDNGTQHLTLLVTAAGAAIAGAGFLRVFRPVG